MTRLSLFRQRLFQQRTQQLKAKTAAQTPNQRAKPKGYMEEEDTFLFI